MARAALRLSVTELATAADLRPSTISAFEHGSDARRSTMDRLRSELEARGAVFIDNGQPSLAGGAGVRLRGETAD